MKKTLDGYKFSFGSQEKCYETPKFTSIQISEGNRNKQVNISQRDQAYHNRSLNNNNKYSEDEIITSQNTHPEENHNKNLNNSSEMDLSLSITDFILSKQELISNKEHVKSIQAHNCQNKLKNKSKMVSNIRKNKDLGFPKSPQNKIKQFKNTRISSPFSNSQSNIFSQKNNELRVHQNTNTAKTIEKPNQKINNYQVKRPNSKQRVQSFSKQRKQQKQRSKLKASDKQFKNNSSNSKSETSYLEIYRSKKYKKYYSLSFFTQTQTKIDLQKSEIQRQAKKIKGTTSFERINKIRTQSEKKNLTSFQNNFQLSSSMKKIAFQNFKRKGFTENSSLEEKNQWKISKNLHLQIQNSQNNRLKSKKMNKSSSYANGINVINGTNSTINHLMKQSNKYDKDSQTKKYRNFTQNIAYEMRIPKFSTIKSPVANLKDRISNFNISLMENHQINPNNSFF